MTPGRLAVAVLLALLPATTPAGAQSTLPEQFALRARMEGNNRPVRVEITLERWSDDSEHERLYVAATAGVPGGFKAELGGLAEVGHLRVDAYRIYPLRYARQIVGADGGRMLLLATEVPIAFQSGDGYFRTTQGAFTLLQIELGQDGEGDGAGGVGEQVSTDAVARTFALPERPAVTVRLSSVRRLAVE